MNPYISPQMESHSKILVIPQVAAPAALFPQSERTA